MSAASSLRPTVLPLLIAAIAMVAGCKEKSKHELPKPGVPKPVTEQSVPATPAAPAPSASASADPPAPAAPKLVNVAGMSAGAFVVNKPRDDQRWLSLINEVPDSVGITANGDGYDAVIALAAPATIERVRFVRAAEISAAKHAQVQVSEQGQDGPWQTVYDADLTAIGSSQRDSRGVSDEAALPTPARARWVRVNFTGGGGGTISVRQFEALAQPAEGAPAERSVSGVYRLLRGFSGASYVAIRQDGATVRGCFGDGEEKGGRVTFRRVAGEFAGGAEPGGYLRYARGSGKDAWRGVMSFSPDGARTAVLEFPGATGGSGTMAQSVNGIGWRVGDYRDACPGDAKATDPVDDALEADKRVTLYGVNFDLDADTLRPESRPALDAVVKAARAHPDWHLAIEGHTDSSGGDAHNQDLSQRRAESVRRYLAAAGVAGDHLGAQGFGASRPVAPNDNPAGRAQNRRVEVARQ